METIFISAPKIPVLHLCDSLIFSTNKLYSFSPCSGLAASMNDGRLYPFVVPYNVNCETTKNSPPTASIFKFIFPSESLNTRSFFTLSAYLITSSGVSVCVIPKYIKNPCLIELYSLLSIITCASLTRCTTNLIDNPFQHCKHHYFSLY